MDTFKLVRDVVHYFNLDSELDDFEKVHDNILKDSVFKGTNLWILVFAIIVASVGLNMNSTAVIIGAMLISPLMGPINAMGYSIATYNFPLFRLSFKNFSFAVAASLLASTFYFILSPISTAHSELLARTSPTIYDVLIALFGGMAGIVATSSRQKGNVIPGVAIATALMPPLCTAGYGLSSGQFDFFFGAIYLFTINTVFIALSSIIISQILKFPIITLVDESQKKRINNLISLVIAIVLLPSIYFGYGLVQKEKFLEAANKYVSNVGIIESNYLLKHEIDPSEKTITLVYGGKTLTENQRLLIIQKAENFEISDANINIRQGLTLEDESDKLVEVFTLREENLEMKTKLQELESSTFSAESNRAFGTALLKELNILFPAVTQCAYNEAIFYSAANPLLGDTTMMVVITTPNKDMPEKDKEKVYKWLSTRLNTKRLRVIYE